MRQNAVAIGANCSLSPTTYPSELIFDRASGPLYSFDASPQSGYIHVVRLVFWIGFRCFERWSDLPHHTGSLRTVSDQSVPIHGVLLLLIVKKRYLRSETHVFRAWWVCVPLC